MGPSYKWVGVISLTIQKKSIQTLLIWINVSKDTYSQQSETLFKRNLALDKMGSRLGEKWENMN